MPGSVPGTWPGPDSPPSISSQTLTPPHRLHHRQPLRPRGPEFLLLATSVSIMDWTFQPTYKRRGTPAHQATAPWPAGASLVELSVTGAAKQTTTKLGYVPTFPTLQWGVGKIQPTRQNANPPSSYSYKGVAGQHFELQKFWHADYLLGESLRVKDLCLNAGSAI